MGVLEAKNRERARKNEMKKLVLEAVKTAGIISVFLVAPNVVGAMAKLGMIPSKRHREIVRRSCDRLVAQGLLEWKDKKLRLTKRGEKILRELEVHEYRIEKPRRWDGKWRVLIFDIPNRRGQLRRQVRGILTTMGFVRLQDSVWVHPYDCEDVIMLLKARFKIGKDLLYMIVDSIENDKYLRAHFGLLK